MCFSVRKVEPEKDHNLLTTFEDRVRVSFNTIAWDDDIDFDPEALYEGGMPLSN